MKIQYITKNILRETYEKIEFTNFEKPKALDSYDMNVVDLSSAEIWKNDSSTKDTINCIMDLNNLSKMIDESNNSKVLYILPQNLTYYNCCGKKYNQKQSCSLIHMKYEFNTIIQNSINHKFPIKLEYENNETSINSIKYDSAFYFLDIGIEPITNAENSGKITFGKQNNIYYTTLNIDYKNIANILLGLEIINGKDELPKWLINYNILDDAEKKEELNEKIKQQQELQEKINVINEKLYNNNELKTILVSSGNDLVLKVCSIFDEIFNLNLNNFEDKKQEDFNFEYNDVLFVGEIKGISTNVKNENISQLDVHCQTCQDKDNEDGVQRKIKGLLIINHQRKEEINKRQPVSIGTINLAIRNQSLIIETVVLLKLYEFYLYNRIDKDQIFNLFNNRIGILNINDIDDVLKK